MAITIQTCEVCDAPLSDELDPLELCSCSTRQSAEFYRGFGEVWTNGKYSVYCAGEMLIHYLNPETNREYTITYPDDLDEIGITKDSDFTEFFALDEEYFTQVYNPWFEVWKESDPDFCSEPLYELDEAIKYALDLSKADETGKVE